MLLFLFFNQFSSQISCTLAGDWAWFGPTDPEAWRRRQARSSKGISSADYYLILSSLFFAEPIVITKYFRTFSYFFAYIFREAEKS